MERINARKSRLICTFLDESLSGLRATDIHPEHLMVALNESIAKELAFTVEMEAIEIMPVNGHPSYVIRYTYDGSELEELYMIGTRI